MEIQWPLVLFTLVAGAGAGTLAAAGAGEFLGAGRRARFLAGVIALILLVAGGLCSLAHLGQAGNVMAAVTNLGSFSGISLELIALAVAVVVALVYVLVAGREGGASKVVGVLGIAVGLAFAYLSGHGYEAVASRPAWAVLPLSLSYLLSSVATGAFVFVALQRLQGDDADAARTPVLLATIVAALSAVSYVIYAVMVPLGDSVALFWGGAVLVGGVVAAAAGVFAYMRGSAAVVWLALIAALAGGLAFRVVMWMAGSAYLPNLFDIASQDRGLFPL
ncbi:MAG: dimethyl sulfoxide reductase anchor subunit [Coriobacteriales bacterium]|jgi:anaerobic dimethyl sulfoxide reductase subunit C (anchor subunit)|nr:dimethyl sulfoxide reductase anchor subunit [Coriobacteriales bacterium]